MTQNRGGPPLPEHLLEPLSWRDYSPAPPARIAVLPFESLTWDEFERFCLQFFLTQYGTFYGFRLHATPGQPQSGYDIWGRTDRGRICAECKRRKRVDLSAIVRSFLSANPDLHADDSFWMFASADLRRRDQTLQKVVKEYADRVCIKICDAHQLTEDLRSKPSVFGLLVEMTFGHDWAFRLYTGIDWLQATLDDWREHDAFSRVLAGTGIYGVLEKIYPTYPLLCFNERRVPVTVFPASEANWRRIESVCATPLLSTTIPHPDAYGVDFDPAGVQHFRVLRAMEKKDPRHYWNGATYVMDQLERHPDGLRLRCRMGRYFQAAATCDALEQELIETLALDPDAALDLGDLPRRRWLHSHCDTPDPVSRGAHRSAAIAISTLVVFFHSDLGRYCYLVNERSTKVQAHPYRFHVIPSLMFQPMIRSDEPHAEYSVRHNVLREFLEELYSVEEVRREHGEANPKWFYKERPIARLLHMLEPDSSPARAHLYYTGVAVNLMNLRPEICTLLLIRDPKWFDEESVGPRARKRIICFNYEYLSDEEASQIPQERRLDRDKLKIYMELDDALRMVKPQLMRPENLVPPAAAAIHLGLSVARRVLGIADR